MLLQQSRYGYGISWTSQGGREVDIDLQCVVVDISGVISDCAYYNNLKAGPGITHSGDETVGKPSGIQEMIWITLRKLKPNVGLLLFVVAAYTGGVLKDVANGQLHILEERESCELAAFSIARCMASVQIIAAMFKDDASWKLRILDVPAQQGHHFMDILPALGQTIQSFIPNAPKKQKVAFAMEKGGILDLPLELGRITVGLGWDVDDGEVDLDVSAVLMDKGGRDLEAVFFGRVESEEHGIYHSGDNPNGEGDGDDEQIDVSLSRIGRQVHQVFFIVNIYTPHQTFRQVANPYCRVVDAATGIEMCRYDLRDAGAETGLIISKIAREAGDRWGFHALGLPCRGRTYKDSLPQIRASCQLRTQSLLIGSKSSDNLSFTSAPPTTPMASWQATPPVAPAPAGNASVCCALQ